MSVPSSRKRRKSKKPRAPYCRGPATQPLRSAVDQALDDWASSWLFARPIQEHGFTLHKGTFRDAIALRYGWEPLGLPSHCACGELFNSCHAFTCSKGVFTITRHNEIRDLAANLLKEICADVEVEPKLQPVSGEEFLHASANQDLEAQLDIKARGFSSGAPECAFCFDVRVFNPRARSNAAAQSTAQMYRHHELSKHRILNSAFRDEMSTFTPLVFSASGGFRSSSTRDLQKYSLTPGQQMVFAIFPSWAGCDATRALRCCARRSCACEDRDSMSEEVLDAQCLRLPKDNFKSELSILSHLHLSFYRCATVQTATKSKNI